MNRIDEGRLRREWRTLDAMIALACRGLRHERQGGGRRALCASCAELRAYAEKRLVACPFGPAKPTCNNCQVHCYQPEMRQRARDVMCFAGPRMLLRHPVLALVHLVVDERRPAPARPARQAPRPDSVNGRAPTSGAVSGGTAR